MVFIDRTNGVSVYGVHDERDIGFKQVRRIRQMKELITKLVSLKRYELGFYMILFSAFMFSLMSFSQFVMLAFAIASFLWVISTVVTSSHNHFYYMKRDIKLYRSHSANAGKSGSHSFQADDMDTSFGDELAHAIVSGKYKPSRIFQGLQSVLIRLLITARRKSFMPFVLQTEVKGHIIKSVSEDGTSSYFMQHFLKQGKNHFAVIELEKFSGQITQIFELKYIPKSSTVVLSVYLKQSDSKTSVATVDALCRELTVISEDEEQLSEAIKTSYFKHCEVLPKYLDKNQDFDFDSIRSVPDIAHDYYAPPLIVPTPQIEKPQDEILTTDKVFSKLAESNIEVDYSTVLTVDLKIDEQVDGQKDKDVDVKVGVTNDNLKDDDVVDSGPKVIFGLEIKPEMPEDAVKLFEEKYKLLARCNNLKNGEWNLIETTKAGVSIYDSPAGRNVLTKAVITFVSIRPTKYPCQ